jgi:hypothetical protein
MPVAALYRRLLEECQGRVVRSDIGWADDAKNAQNKSVEQEFMGMATLAEWTEWKRSQTAATNVNFGEACGQRIELSHRERLTGSRCRFVVKSSATLSVFSLCQHGQRTQLVFCFNLRGRRKSNAMWSSFPLDLVLSDIVSNRCAPLWSSHSPTFSCRPAFPVKTTLWHPVPHLREDRAWKAPASALTRPSDYRANRQSTNACQG